MSGWRSTHFLLPGLVAVVMTLLISGPARAQNGTPPAVADPDPMLFLSIGTGGVVVPNRWNHVRAEIEGGAKAVAGTVIVESGTEGGVAFRALAPFVATPGVRTGVDLAVVIPRENWFHDRIWLRATLIEDSGRVIRRVRYSTIPSNVELPLPTLELFEPVIVLSVGGTSLDDAGRAWLDPAKPIGNPENETSFEPLPPEDWAIVHVCGMKPDALPRTWAAYDCVKAVSISADALDAVEDGVAATIMRWVRSGGCLIVTGQTVGRDMSRWIPDEICQLRQDGAGSVGPVLGARGKSEHWTTRRVIFDELPGPPLHRASVVIGEGPVGLGWAVMLGMDPRRMSDRLDPAMAWQELLRPIVSEDVLHPERRAEANRWGQTPGVSSKGLLNALVEHMHGSARPPVLVLVLMALILIFMLGPGDRILLGRLGKRHLSWANAIAWIALVSLAAYAWPKILRSGESELARVSVVDAIKPGADESVSAWRSSATAVLTGSSGDRRFTGLAAGSWWRRLSASNWNERNVAPGFIQTDQRVGAEPGSVPMDIWTLHTFADDAATECPWEARVEVGPGTSARVKVSGRGVDDETDVYVQLKGAGLQMHMKQAAAETLTGEAVIAPDAEFIMPLQIDSPLENWWERRPSTFAERHGLSLSGPVQRTMRMRTLVETGDWALVCLVMSGLPSDVGLDEPCSTRQRTVVRMLVPLERVTEPQS